MGMTKTNCTVNGCDNPAWPGHRFGWCGDCDQMTYDDQAWDAELEQLREDRE